MFSEVFDFVQKALGVDTILIDTRAGFNQWGSLSLLTLSNQVIFVAYPNAENIEGLNVALELIRNIGRKRYAVAMSKVVATDEGGARAKELFGDLKVAQEELIPVYYRQEIALSNCYPIVTREVLDAYKELSDYILNNEKIEKNREMLASGEKQQMLEKLFTEQKKYIELRTVQRFQYQKVNVLLKYRYNEELYGIHNGVTQYYRKQDTILKELPH